MKFTGVLALVALALTGCQEVEFEDGRVPRQHLPLVQQFVGAYRGDFFEQPGTLRVRLDGDYVDIVFRGDWGYDILRGCEAQLGRILGLKFRGHHQRELDFVRFDFYPGHCADHYSGREFFVKIVPVANGKFRFETSVVKGQEAGQTQYFRGVFQGPNL